MISSNFFLNKPQVAILQLFVSSRCDEEDRSNSVEPWPGEKNVSHSPGMCLIRWITETVVGTHGVRHYRVDVPGKHVCRRETTALAARPVRQLSLRARNR